MKFSPWLWLLIVFLCSIRACYLYWSSTRELRGMDSSITWPSLFRQHRIDKQLSTSSLSMSNDTTVIGSSPSNMFYFTQVHSFYPIIATALTWMMIDLRPSYFKVPFSRTYASLFTFCTISASHDQVCLVSMLALCVNVLTFFFSDPVLLLSQATWQMQRMYDVWHLSSIKKNGRCIVKRSSKVHLVCHGMTCVGIMTVLVSNPMDDSFPSYPLLF